MTRFGWLALGGCVLALAAVALLVWGFTRQSTTLEEVNTVQRTPIIDPEALSIYTNGVYGFSFFYPSAARAEDATTTDAWRVNATDDGTAIVRVIMATDEVRIGASQDDDAVGSCIESGPAEKELQPLTVGDIAWHVFSYDQLGTENQIHVTSYRTVHEDTCFAVEAHEPIGAGIPPEDSDAALVVRNFTFAR